MIYRFTFEVTDDDNKHIFTMRKEESGTFWWAFTTFMHYVLIYASKTGLDRKGP